MTRAELRHKVLFERWLIAGGDLTFSEWLDSLRERAAKLRLLGQTYSLQQSQFQGMLNAQMQQSQHGMLGILGGLGGLGLGRPQGPSY